MSGDFRHQPVMVHEVVQLLTSVPPGVVVDATVGGGGHARALLDALPHIQLVGLDRDDEAVAAARFVLAPYGARAVVVHVRFDQLTTTLQELGHESATGVLFDLGVSSPQLDRPERGFSFHADAPLDMRMDRRDLVTAADVVNTYSEDRLARVLAMHGDERFSRRIARAVVAARPLHTTGQLAEVVRSAIPAPARRRGGHPARRTFQALRIEVNQEVALLPGALDRAVDLLAPGGRCIVLSYHSGEDRIVKERFAEAASGGCSCPPGLPCACGAVPVARVLTRGARRPRPEEVAANPRSESARLRAVEKLSPGEAEASRVAGPLPQIPKERP